MAVAEREHMAVGFDEYEVNRQLLLSLTFEEMTGLRTYDRARPDHALTLNGVPIWSSLANGLPYLDFNEANPDYLVCPAVDTADLDFTTEDFSMVAWVNADIFGGIYRTIMCRGVPPADGWAFYLSTGSICLWTNAGLTQQWSCSTAGMVIGTWYLVGATRSGTSVRTYVQGVDATEIAGTHADLASANRGLYIGSLDGGIGNRFDGKMWNPRIWGRTLAPWEMMELFMAERHWFGA